MQKGTHGLEGIGGRGLIWKDIFQASTQRFDEPYRKRSSIMIPDSPRSVASPVDPRHRTPKNMY